MTNDVMYQAVLIGLGRIGWRGFGGAPAIETHTSAIMAHPGIKLVAAVDSDAGVRAAFQQYSGAYVYEDVWQALRHDPEIAVVATPPETHADIVCGLSAYGSIRGFLCEKPLAPSLQECRRMVDACAKHNKVLLVGHQRRYEQRHRLLRAFLKSGTLGSIHAAACRFSGDSISNGSHAADTLRFLIGDECPISLLPALNEEFTVRLAGEHGSISLSSRGDLEPGYMRTMYNDLIECMETDKTPECSGADGDRKSTRLNSSHIQKSRMPSSA